MFPFIFKLWRYQGIPAVGDVPDISRTSPVAPATPAASERETEMDDIYNRAQLQKTWQETYLPRLWGSPHPQTGSGPGAILAVDDGEPSFESALKTASFLARQWKASLVESPVTISSEDIFRIAEREGAGWLVVSKKTAEVLLKETRLPILVDSNGTLANGIRRILVPVDGTPSSLVAVAEGVRWAKTFAAELMVLHVAESAEKETEHAAFLDVLQTIGWQSVVYETQKGEGTIADALLQAAQASAADLIVMTTRQVLIAVEVVRRSPIPVFILHASEP